MKKTQTAILAVLMACFTFALPAAAEVNSDDHNILLRGALGGGRILWAHVNHGSGSGDLGTGPGGVFNFAGMYGYRFLGVEGNLMVGNISTLEWSDEDNGGVSHDWESDGSGYYSVFDLKIGARLFISPGDMGYTFIYAGLRTWSTERDESSLTFDGVKYSTEYKYKANGGGWILGFRDFSTIGANNGFAIVVQSGLFFGKAPLDKITRNGEDMTQEENETLTLGGELAGGVALQDRGISLIGGFRGEINMTTFFDSVPTGDDESVFGFGNIVFFVEAGVMF